jgi:hypothetical protein
VDAAPAHPLVDSLGLVAAIGLLLAGMLILFCNVQRFGDPLEISTQSTVSDSDRCADASRHLGGDHGA